MGDKKIYIVAKAFNKQGSYAYLCKSKDELECVPETLQLMSRRGIQIVLVNNPDIYSEYAPYNYIENLTDFVEKVIGEELEF